MIAGLHHVGLSTPDIERAIAFYTSLFGFEVMWRGGWEPGNEARDRQHEASGTAARAAVLERAGMHLEVRQYFAPAGAPQRVDRPVVDHGINHFCIAVVDIEAEYARLADAGMRFHTEPLEVAPGLWVTYGRDPDGNVIELIEGDIHALGGAPRPRPPRSGASAGRAVSTASPGGGARRGRRRAARAPA